MYFITALIDLNEDINREKSIDRYIDLFMQLVNTNIKIVSFVSGSLINRLKERTITNRNVILVSIDIEDLDTYKEVINNNVSLPQERNHSKDTFRYMVIMNAKIEFIYRAIQLVNDTHYAWIDFGIFHVLHDNDRAIKCLKFIAKSRWKQRILAIPGCWDRSVTVDLWNRIAWRFCGGFVLGDKLSLLNFYKLYRKVFPKECQNRLTWEVNFWALLEQRYGLNVQFYPGDHNNTIIEIPRQHLGVVACINSKDSLLSLIPQVEKLYLNRDVGVEDRNKIRVFNDSPLNHISSDRWIFFGNDNTVYHSNFINHMLLFVDKICVYHCDSGLLVHRSILNRFHNTESDQTQSMLRHFNENNIDIKYLTIV